MVLPTARRNNNFSVICRGAASYFVKSLLPGAAQAVETLRQEAALYGLAQSEPALAPLREVLPAFYFFDPQRSLLVLEHLDGAKTISELHTQNGVSAAWAAEMAGRALGNIHRATAEALPQIDPATFRRQTPWALSLHQITPSFGQPGMPDSDRNAQLQRCASYVVARLLQSTMEMLVVTPVMSTQVALLLQTSLNILRDPTDTVRLVIGEEAAVHA